MGQGECESSLGLMVAGMSVCLSSGLLPGFAVSLPIPGHMLDKPRLGSSPGDTSLHT